MDFISELKNDASTTQCKTTVLDITPKSRVLCCTSEIPRVGPTFTVSSYDAVCTKNRTHHLQNTEMMRYVIRQSHTQVSQVQKVIHTQLFVIVKATTKSAHPDLKKTTFPSDKTTDNQTNSQREFSETCIFILRKAIGMVLG